jgi:hypothetical protein
VDAITAGVDTNADDDKAGDGCKNDEDAVEEAITGVCEEGENDGDDEVEASEGEINEGDKTKDAGDEDAVNVGDRVEVTTGDGEDEVDHETSGA